ncbi:hypothetical protein P691DRAFT_721023 [Macrolepiota fuliginosa MF-IS2]|uniref:Peptidase S9 prolyl oligopeptidase catalytic domain-containing protein n=1 Tax=Macrolepiota fuliginosa MF-IS2 TaxID=1400762 RepID=A0A9P5XNC3_9AGAR|nr:hypothetical protein P691DRAFT_721023 [Macrolepiota fuliginosa MF-IS2]
MMASAQLQATFRDTQDQNQWKLELSKNWDVLGPFPIHAREQQFLSPSFPIDLLKPINYEETWTSSYADNATVQWSHTQPSDDNVLEVSFPEVRWENLRRTEGWAALQHHAILRGTITLEPPPTATSEVPPVRLLVHLKQGSYFTILPADVTDRKDLIPEWYAGNIYDMERALPREVYLPTIPNSTISTNYDIFISGDYEIRLFGDPRRYNTEIPTQVIGISVEVEYIQKTLRREPSQDISCDFLDGHAFGKAIGIALRSITDRWTVTRVASENPEIHVQLKNPTRIAPSQLRIIPLTITQDKPFYGNNLLFAVTATHESGQEHHIPISMPVTQLSAVQPHEPVALKATYIFGDAMPTAFLAIPPTNKPRTSHPPILALHGAGVDIFDQSFWAQSLPRSNLSWTILPSGRTSWGLDWHGPSAQDAWDCVDALAEILGQSSSWKETAFSTGTSMILLGHSNGGQGVWHLSSRYPDRVIAIVPAAGYIKSQAYVPLTISAHFIDPALRAILESSLTPDDSDLFLTNVINKPVLVIHGGDDDNVPVWHGREAFSIVKTWASLHGITPNITMKEDEGQLHWYPSVLNNDQVKEFIQQHVEGHRSDMSETPRPFTLTVFRPEESGSLNGWKIEEVKCPGRLARLTVVPLTNSNVLDIKTINVKSFSGPTMSGSYALLRVDGQEVSLTSAARDSVRFERESLSYEWRLSITEPLTTPSAPTQLQSFLLGRGLITFILPKTASTRRLSNIMSLGSRLAYDLHLYHRLDTEMVYDDELITPTGFDWPKYNFAVIGSLKDPLIRSILGENKTPLSLRDGLLMLNGRRVRTHSGTGMILLHPHPISTEALVMLIIGESAEALERAARLFPIRTGIAVPSWVILEPTMDILGAAGISGAGIWGPDWTWNEAFSWSEVL